jgi:peptide/nickel transport system permease protein
LIKYLVIRILNTIPVVLGVSVFVFLMLHLIPGDPVAVLMANTPVSKEQMDLIRENLGLNQPLVTQYGNFLWNAVQGDLGRSMRTNRPVSVEIMERFPSTIQLALASVLIAALLGISMGILSALHQNTWIDTLSTVLALSGVSMPVFWLGLMLIFIFSMQLGWFPATGQGGIIRLILPAITLGWGSSGIIARLTRSSMLEVIRLDYIVVARAKGIAERLVIIRHALSNALIPVVTIIGLQFGNLLAGTVITETVFGRPGLGRMIVEGILQKDFPVVQGAVLVTATMYVIANLLVDITYAVIDPRIRVSMGDNNA